MWENLIDFLIKNRHKIWNTSAVIFIGVSLFHINKRLKETCPRNLTEYLKYIATLNWLIGVALTYNIYQFNISKILEEQIKVLFGLILKEISSINSQENQFNMIELEHNIQKLQTAIDNAKVLWVQRQETLSKIPEIAFQSDYMKALKSNYTENFQTHLKAMVEELEEMNKLREVEMKKEINQSGGSFSKFSLNPWLIVSLFTIILAIKNPDEKTIVLMKKILSYFSNPNDPNKN
jgi:hypothetical protein